MPEVASQTLDLVGRELNNTLGEARTALEPSSSSPKTSCCCSAASRTCTRCRACCACWRSSAPRCSPRKWSRSRTTCSTPASQKNQAETLDALMRAMVQLPSYVERVLSGGRDLALVLLPLLNDPARRARQRAAVRRHAAAAQSQVRPAGAPVARRRRAALTVAQWARRLRTRFQLGLLGWIRGERLEQNLEILETVAHQLEQVATTAAGVPALVGRRRDARSAARRRPRGRRVDQASAGSRRSRNPAAVQAGRGALRAEPAGRAAEQPSLLRRARHQLRSKRSPPCVPRSVSTSC